MTVLLFDHVKFEIHYHVLNYDVLNYDVLKSEILWFLLNKRENFNENKIESKRKILQTFSESRALRFSIHETNSKLKIKL